MKEEDTRMKQKGERIVSIILTVALFILSFPIVVRAEGEAIKEGTIASFVPLEESIKTQIVEQGTTLEDIILPDTITAYVYQAKQQEDAQAKQELHTVETALSVNWNSDPSYDPAISKEYHFTPVIDKDLLTTDVELPLITVKVKDTEPQKGNTLTSENVAKTKNVVVNTVVPNVERNYIFANGLPLIITGENDTSTTIYVDYNHSGSVDAGDKSLHEIDPSLPEDEADLSMYWIYGGGYYKAVTGDTSIIMEGGKVLEILGGGFGDSIEGNTKVEMRGGVLNTIYGGGSANNTVNNTHIEMKGGTANYILGGGTLGAVKGNTNITIESGANVEYTILGGGSNTMIEGDTNIQIEKVELNAHVYGGGELRDSSVKGNTNVIVKNSKINKNVYGGGRNGSVVNDTNVEIHNSEVKGSVYGGGEVRSIVNGKTNVLIDGNSSINVVYGGSYDGDVEETLITLKQGNVGSIYGGSNKGNVEKSNIDIQGGNVSGSVYGGNLNTTNTIGETNIKIVNAVVSESVYGSTENGNISTIHGAKLTVGGSTTIGGHKYGIQMNSPFVLNGFDSFEIEPDLTGSVSVYLPSDYGNSGVIATNAVDSDAAKINLIGAGAKNVIPYFDETTKEIKVGIEPKLALEEFQRTDAGVAQFTLTSDVDGDVYYGIVAPNEAEPSISTMTFLGDIKAGQAIPKQISKLTNKAQVLWVFVKDGNGNIGKVKYEIPAILYVLTVEDGTGAGSYEEGTEVSISANPASAYMAFDHWEGGENSIFLTNRTESTTNIKMPAKAITLKAIYKHVHHFHTEWQSNEKEHWHTCVWDDGAVSDQEAHQFGDWIVDEYPTLEKEGSKHRSCGACGYVERQSMEKLTVIYAKRTLIDAVTKIQVSGYFSEDATLEVKQGDILHASGSCAVCDELRQKPDIIFLYDISLKSGSYQGEVEVSIPVGEAYNAQEVEFLHCNKNTLESITVMVENGLVKGSFSSLSPYAIRMIEKAPVEEQSEEPIKKTAASPNENTAILLWMLAASMMFFGGWTKQKKKEVK